LGRGDVVDRRDQKTQIAVLEAREKVFWKGPSSRGAKLENSIHSS